MWNSGASLRPVRRAITRPMSLVTWTAPPEALIRAPVASRFVQLFPATTAAFACTKALLAANVMQIPTALRLRLPARRMCAILTQRTTGQTSAEPFKTRPFRDVVAAVAPVSHRAPVVVHSTPHVVQTHATMARAEQRFTRVIQFAERLTQPISVRFLPCAMVVADASLSSCRPTPAAPILGMFPSARSVCAWTRITMKVLHARYVVSLPLGV